MKTKNFLINIAVIISLLFEGSISLFAQTQWTKDVNNPVLKRDTILTNLPNDIIAISDCWVVKEGSTYKMWYTCGGMNYPADTLLRSRLCYATSSNGINWNKYNGNPILDVSYTGGWDSLGAETASVIIDSFAPISERYKMWYAGQYYNDYRYDIGYAFSADGINWTKHSGPVLQVGSFAQWDNGFLEGPSVIKDGNTYKMWYCGYDASVNGNTTDGHANIGYATSSDGINWIKHPSNPILITGINSWDSIYVQDPHVIKQGSIYHMWFGGGSNASLYDQQVGYASSADGINWIKSPLNPVLERGNAGEWDATVASFPSVIDDTGQYKMWYTGKDVDPLPPNSLDYYWEIGYATASVTDIDDINNDSFTLFPNPFSLWTTIKIAEIVNDATLTVYNLTGQQVKQIKNISGQTIIMHRDNLPCGVYFIRLTQDNKTLTTDKIIISDN